MKKLLFLSFIFLAMGCNKPTSTSQNSQSSNTTQAKFAIIALNDNGKLGKQIGCDDSVVFINSSGTSATEPLNDAFKALFNFNEQSFSNSQYKDAELNNIIFSAQRIENKKVLFFDKASLEGNVAKLYLTGSMGSIGGVCDEPRVIEQINSTALQFPQVKTVEVYLNGKLFDLAKFYSQK